MYFFYSFCPKFILHVTSGLRSGVDFQPQGEEEEAENCV